MDYEKKYNEALERASRIKDNNTAATPQEVAEHIFPELLKSEDERIRKELIAQVEFIIPYENECDEDGNILPAYRERIERYRTYLEKQKDNPKSAVEVLARAGLKPYKDGNQWCILAGDNIQEGICGFGDTIDEALYQFLMEVLEKQKEQKPADKEQDSIAFLEQHGYTIVPPHAPVSIVPSSEATLTKWSAEDEKMINDIIYCLPKMAMGNIEMLPSVAENYAKRLKSLRPSWKPSEEQMEALKSFLDYHRPIRNGSVQNWQEFDNLESLYEQLQKI